jgi:hypothetical protein
MNKNTNIDNFSKGFTQIPHIVGNILPCLSLSSREYRTVLIIIRLTYGCGRGWAYLNNNDLTIGNIAPPHAGKVIKGLLKKKVVVKNKTTKKEYRLNEKLLKKLSKKESAPNLEKFGKLVGKNLYIKRTYGSGNDPIATMRKSRLLEKEYIGYQNGNKKGLPKRKHLASQNSEIDTTIDKEIQKDKDKAIDNRNPHLFVAQSSTQFAAQEAWKKLEPHNPDSFGFYLSMAKKGLPECKFYELCKEIELDRKINNKGAAFVKKALTALKRLEAQEG